MRANKLGKNYQIDAKLEISLYFCKHCVAI